MDVPVDPQTEQTGTGESEILVPQTEQTDSGMPTTDDAVQGKDQTTDDTALEPTQPVDTVPDKIDAAMNTDASTVAEQATETTRQDLVEAQEKKQNSDDKEFLEREWQKERARRDGCIEEEHSEAQPPRDRRGRDLPVENARLH